VSPCEVSSRRRAAAWSSRPSQRVACRPRPLDASKPLVAPRRRRRNRVLRARQRARLPLGWRPRELPRAVRLALPARASRRVLRMVAQTEAPQPQQAPVRWKPVARRAARVLVARGGSVLRSPMRCHDAVLEHQSRRVIGSRPSRAGCCARLVAHAASMPVPHASSVRRASRAPSRICGTSWAARQVPLSLGPRAFLLRNRRTRRVAPAARSPRVPQTPAP